MVADPLRFAPMSLPALVYRLIGRFSVSRVDRTLHPFLYRLTGGRGVLGRVLGCEMLLLTTKGRRTGKPRTVTLFAFPINEPANSWAVIGSRGGSGGIPSWYRNLKAVPDAEIQIRRQRRSVRTREIFEEAYEAVFEQAARVYPGYRLYRDAASQHIPIVVLEPAAGQFSTR